MRFYYAQEKKQKEDHHYYKYSAAIGYDYDKALERCQKRRAKEGTSRKTGMDGIEALLRRDSSSSVQAENRDK